LTGRGKTVLSENYSQFRLSFPISKARGFYFATVPILVALERVTKLSTGVSDENLWRKFQIWLKYVQKIQNLVKICRENFKIWLKPVEKIPNLVQICRKFPNLVKICRENSKFG
jgi:hypothetical protein